MSTETHDWSASTVTEGEERTASPFGEQLTRVKGHDGDHHPSWQFCEKAAEDAAIPRQTLEKIYLSPPIDVQGDFRNIFVSFLIFPSRT